MCTSPWTTSEKAMKCVDAIEPPAEWPEMVKPGVEVAALAPIMVHMQMYMHMRAALKSNVGRCRDSNHKG